MNLVEGKVRILLHNIIKLSKYRPWGEPVKPKVVYIMDGSNYMGGLADRIRQIMGVYAVCKHKGYEFRLVANAPFELWNYLKPNYDWRIEEDEISRNIFFSKPIYLGYRSKEKYMSLITLEKRQLHLFASVQWEFITDLGFSMKQLFWELFTPAPQIKDFIAQSRTIYKSWDSMVFRFQDLLEDFNEAHSAQYLKIKLSEVEKEELINKCYNYVLEQQKIAKQHILVCSDSTKFLKRVESIPGVFIIPGELTHMEFSAVDNFELHLKSFLDLFMISESNSVRSVGTDIMYPSDFPVLAANINNVPFERIRLK